MNFAFWFDERHGLIRQRSTPGALHHPEVWVQGRWVQGTPALTDAITGMGEDAWSSGEAADRWDDARAEAYAAAHGIALRAEPA